VALERWQGRALRSRRRGRWATSIAIHVNGGDLHRADMAWARHGAGMGLSASVIRAQIMRTRDLSKKGSEKRQREYAERTAGKAVRQAEQGRGVTCGSRMKSGTITTND
jgi:hypothetical protein